MKISTEGATPNSEGRKPWIYTHYLGVRSVGPTPIIFIRCRTYGAH